MSRRLEDWAGFAFAILLDIRWFLAGGALGALLALKLTGKI
jgi:hypothetical protein